MSHTAAIDVDPADLGEVLRRRTNALGEALAEAGEAVDPELAERTRTDLATVRSRLRLGVDRTVVALVGGTGSGKSSLFNAISGLQFADVGGLRPTTNEASACVWGGTADELLDFLDVAPGRRITRESVLDADQEKDLQRMVLLDLPDHDSVARDHWEQVDRLVPLVDVLVWVVDPQKYADNALHERYLRELAGRQEAMLVVINQTDTVPPRAVEQVRQDVRGLLADEGLAEVTVLATSATTMTGVQEVREVLARAVARPSTAARTAAAEAAAVSRRLRGSVAAGEPVLAAADVDDTAAELARACGAGAVADSIRTAVAGAGAVARPARPAPATVAAIRADWVERATTALPPRWAAAVHDCLADGPEIADAAADAVDRVPLPGVRQPRATRLAVAAAVLTALAAAYLAVVLVLGGTWELAVVPAVAAVLASGALLVAARASRRTAGERLAQEYAEAARAGTRGVVEELLARPSAAVLGRHRRLREALITD